MPMYSHSRLSVYETCPRQYRYQYVDRVPLPELETVEMFMGSQVHAALENLYRQVAARKMPALDEVLAGYGHRWAADWRPEIQVSRPELRPDDYRRQGEAHLATYYHRYHPFDGERTVAMERRIVFPLDEPRRIWIQGYIDRLSVTRDGLWQIHDYKTGRWLPTQQDLDRDRQLALYQIGVQRHFPKHAREVELVWHYLAHDLEMRSRRTPAELGEIEARTLELIDTIQADRDHALVEGSHCRRCAYQPICPAWSHLFQRETLAEPARLREEGGALVDRLATLKAERAELDAAIAQTEAELLDYAQQHKVESVFGATHRVRISVARGVSYPRKDDPRRERLEALLKAAGRWADVSALDARALARKAGDPAWPAELRGAVKEFEDAAERFRITLSRLKETQT
jgi:putative RecB family exonuclease